MAGEVRRRGVRDAAGCGVLRPERRCHVGSPDASGRAPDAAAHPPRRVPRWGVVLLALALGGPSLCSGGHGQLEVVATAYTSHPEQTWGDPRVAAWGDRLEPGTRAVAVSRDLLRMGLRRGDTIRIEGLPGEYRVLDKMSRRWRRRIDVYMGLDREAARAFGRREVTIRWGHD